MKVHKLIEKLQMVDGELEAWVSSNGIDYAVVDEIEKDGEGALLILGEIKRSY